MTVASKRRIRRNKCEGKVRYPSMDEAIGAACALRRIEKKASWQAQAYRCSFCGGFHVGHGGKIEEKW